MNLDSWCLITNVSEVKLPRYLIVGHVALETQFRDGRKEEQLAIPSRPLSHFGTMLLQLLLLVKQLFSRLLAVPFAFIIAAAAATCSISVIIQAVARACVSAVLHLSSWIRGSVNCTHWGFCWSAHMNGSMCARALPYFVHSSDAFTFLYTRPS